MLKKGIENYFFIFYSFLFITCNNSDSNIGNTLKSNQYVKNNFNNYSEEYTLLNDSIRKYVAVNLKLFGVEYLYEWQVDSMMCINSKRNLLIGVIISSVGVINREVTDDASKILGKKINGRWFFFKGGGSLAILRSSFGKSGQSPLTFYELSQIARKNLLESSLLRDKNGNYIVNDDWVEKHFYNVGYGKYNSKAKYDSVHWHIILNKWKHKIDTNQYKPLQKNKNSEATP